jgi:hypothetical protein
MVHPAPPLKPRAKMTSVQSDPTSLWQQLTPQIRHQMTRQWAAMIQKMRQPSQRKEGDHVQD